MPTDAMKDSKDAIEEYKELGTNMRHYSNMRFAQMTLFFAFNGAVISIAFNGAAKTSDDARMKLEILGFVVSACILVMEFRSASYWRCFKKRSLEIEEVLGFRQYKDASTPKWVNATNATKTIYGLVILFWLLSVVPLLMLRSSELAHENTVVKAGKPKLPAQRRPSLPLRAVANRITKKAPPTPSSHVRQRRQLKK